MCSDEDLEVENENANHNQPPSTNHDFRISDQVFMQHFRDRIANQLLESEDLLGACIAAGVFALMLWFFFFVFLDVLF
ncbi:hypothetical protein EZV62_025257 [Acer yangbiense]|uniref:Uncharacterized protein n=1 Tax=Acer yangbiense TaxID=1000413 RepID=A0A5C7GYJ6_9ROSI|nr:hypothetical protein EZV62_025257 [Acer yangbiense]